MAATGGRVFVLTGGILYRADVEGRYEQLGGSWDGRAMVAARGSLYIFNGDGSLYRVDPATGDYVSISSGWSGTTGAAVLGDKIFVTCDGALYTVDLV